MKVYQVIIETWVDGVREEDRVLAKTYEKKGFAERKAKKCVEVNPHIVRKAYVRPLLNKVTEEEAKNSYCHGKPVYIDCEYGKREMPPSHLYGSHAPASELFYRSRGWGYKGNYYLEAEM